jgi:hypothetical protein
MPRLPKSSGDNHGISDRITSSVIVSFAFSINDMDEF